MDISYVRRKDTTKGPPLRVLSLGECVSRATGRAISPVFEFFSLLGRPALATLMADVSPADGK